MKAKIIQIKTEGHRCNVFYWRGGTGMPVVLLQGGMANAELHWKPVWNELEKYGDVIAPDLPGFGHSSQLHLYNWLTLSTWLYDFLRELDIYKAIIIGNSFGGTLGRAFSSFYPEYVSHLILVNGGNFIRLRKPLKLIMASPIGKLYTNSLKRKGINKKSLQNMIFAKHILNKQFVSQSLNGSGTIFPIIRTCLAGPEPENFPEAEILIIWGENDKHSPVNHVYSLQKQLPGSKIVKINNAGHLPQIEQPQNFVEVIYSFIK